MSQPHKDVLENLRATARGLVFGDEAKRDAVVRRAGMVIRKLLDANSKYLRDLDDIAFHPRFAPSSPIHKQQHWEDAKKQFINLINTVEEELDWTPAPTEFRQPIKENRVFISWSGALSHELALALHNWLPRVVDGVIPWVSSEDIAKGARWNPTIAMELDRSQFGIICIVPGITSEPWILFEAGAISKSMMEGRVAPLLCGVTISQLSSPLAQFQCTLAEKDDVFKLALSISSAGIGPNATRAELRARFEQEWPSFELVIAEISEKARNEHAGSDKSKSQAGGEIPGGYSQTEKRILEQLSIKKLLSLSELEQSLPDINPARVEVSLSKLCKRKGLLGVRSAPGLEDQWAILKEAKVQLVEDGVL